MTDSRIPLDPRDNLARMESIVNNRWKPELVRKEEFERRSLEAHARLREVLKLGYYPEQADTALSDDERKVIESKIRRHEFALRECVSQIRKLRSQIKWAETIQIPFLQEEVDGQEADRLGERLMTAEEADEELRAYMVEGED